MVTWVCPKCDWVTQQPEAVQEVGHPCRGGRPAALQKLDAPMVNVRAAIVAESLARFPQEACGLLLSTGTTVIAQNVSTTPETSFVVDPDTVGRWWPLVVGVWHSHCGDPAVPSQADEELAQPGHECWIYSVLDEELGIYKKDKRGKLQLVAMEDMSNEGR